MNRTLVALIGGMTGLLAVAAWASNAGWGMPVPVKEPPSIREGSTVGKTHRGATGTRYFIGGGFHAGK
jgi:hypothetical protein